MDMYRVETVTFIACCLVNRKDMEQEQLGLHTPSPIPNMTRQTTEKGKKKDKEIN